MLASTQRDADALGPANNTALPSKREPAQGVSSTPQGSLHLHLHRQSPPEETAKSSVETNEGTSSRTRRSALEWELLRNETMAAAAFNASRNSVISITPVIRVGWVPDLTAHEAGRIADGQKADEEAQQAASQG